jgi:hypothetical protein
LFREFAAARRRRAYDAARDVTVAWHAVRLWVEVNNRKKLPSLASQLPQTGATARRQTVGQLRSSLVILSEQYGIPLRRREAG